MSATSFEELRNRMVAILTTLADTPPGSGITEVTSVDGSIIIDNTDPSAPDLSLPSGTFTPTISSITPSAVTVPTVSDMIYQKVGNVVTCSFYFEILFDGETSVTFNFSLPIASNFNAPSDLIGSISKDVADGDTWVTVSANDSLNLGSINAVTVAQNNFNSYVTFQYVII
jgi:hypothetical protein